MDHQTHLYGLGCYGPAQRGFTLQASKMICDEDGAGGQWYREASKVSMDIAVLSEITKDVRGLQGCYKQFSSRLGQAQPETTAQPATKAIHPNNEDVSVPGWCPLLWGWRGLNICLSEDTTKTLGSSENIWKSSWGQSDMCVT